MTTNHWMVGARVGPDLRQLDPDRAPVGGARVPGRVGQVQGLVDGPVDIQHEVHAESAEVVQHLEALAAGAAGVEVDHELVDPVLHEDFEKGREARVVVAPSELVAARAWCVCAGVVVRGG